MCFLSAAWDVTEHNEASLLKKQVFRGGSARDSNNDVTPTTSTVGPLGIATSWLHFFYICGESVTSNSLRKRFNFCRTGCSDFISVGQELMLLQSLGNIKQFGVIRLTKQSKVNRNKLWNESVVELNESSHINYITSFVSRMYRNTLNNIDLQSSSTH